MPDTKYKTQYVGNAHSGRIPWHLAKESKPMTLKAARLEIDEWRRQLRERCSPASWDSHMRIVPLEDTMITFTWHCYGYFNGKQCACPDAVQAEITYPWPAGKGQPSPPSAPGWHSGSCPVCAERTGAWYHRRPWNG